MDIAQETLDRVGKPESELLEYKAVLPPAATVAQLICAFANAKGGAIVLGVVDDGKEIPINGLSDEFRAVQITRKAIDLLSPAPAVSYDYVVQQGKRIFVIEVRRSSAEVSLGGKVYIRTGERTTLKQTGTVKTITDPGIDRLSKAMMEDRESSTEARAKLPDHYESVLRVLDHFSKLLYPKGSRVPTDNPEGKMLMRILLFMRGHVRRSCRISCTRLSREARDSQIGRTRNRQGGPGLFRHSGVHHPLRQGEAPEAATQERQRLHLGQPCDQVTERVRSDPHRRDRKDPADPTPLHAPERHRG